MAMDAKRRKQLTDKLKEINKGFFKLEEKKDVEAKVSDKAKKMAEILNAMAPKLNVDYLATFVQLMGEVIGEDISALVKSTTPAWKLPFLVTVVPIGNSNSHQYELNHPVVVYKPAQSWEKGMDVGKKKNGSDGNQLTMLKTELRPATEAEIDMLTDEQLVGMDHLIPV